MKKIAIIKGDEITHYDRYNDTIRDFVAQNISEWFEIEESDLNDLQSYIRYHEPSFKIIQFAINSKNEFDELRNKAKQFIKKQKEEEEKRKRKAQLAAQKAKETKMRNQEEKERETLARLQQKYDIPKG